MYSLYIRLINLLFEISQVLMDGIYHIKCYYDFMPPGHKTSQIHPHLLSKYLTTTFHAFLTSYSDSQKENWLIFLNSSFEVCWLFSVHVLNPFCHELMSPLSLKESQRSTSSVKSPLDEPQSDPVISIISDSRFFDAQGRENRAFKLYFYYVPDILLKP